MSVSRKFLVDLFSIFYSFAFLLLRNSLVTARYNTQIYEAMSSAKFPGVVIVVDFEIEHLRKQWQKKKSTIKVLVEDSSIEWS